MQQSLQYSHWNAEVEVWVGDFGSQVPGVAGHNTCKTTILISVKIATTAVQNEKSNAFCLRI